MTLVWACIRIVQLFIKPRGQGSAAEKALDSIIWCNWCAAAHAIERRSTFFLGVYNLMLNMIA